MTRARGIPMLLVLLCFVPALRGQTRLRIGAEAGVNVATAAASPLADGVATSPRTGLMAGLLFEVPVSSAWSLTVSPRFIEKGAELRYRDALVETALLNYVEASVAARWTLPHAPLSPFLTAGCTVGRLVSGRYRIEFQRGYTTQYVKELLAQWDLALDVGAGLSYDAGGGNAVFVSAVYSFGLMNVNDGAAGVGASRWHARGLRVSTGFAVGL